MLDYSQVSLQRTYILLSSSIHCCCAHLFLPLLLFSPLLHSSSPPFFLPSSPPPLPSVLSAIPPPHSFQLRFDQFKLRFLEENPNVKDGMRNGWRYLLEGVSAACDIDTFIKNWATCTQMSTSHVIYRAARVRTVYVCTFQKEGTDEWCMHKLPWAVWFLPRRCWLD